MRNPFQYNLPVDPDRFVGRWPLVERMALELTIDRGDSFALIAGRRMGKSSLLRALSHQLRAGVDGDWLPLVIPYDLKREPQSAEHFFALILRAVQRRVGQNVRRRPKDAWPHPIALDEPWFGDLLAADALALEEFEDALGHVLEKLETPLAQVRVILLLDEGDEIVNKPWCDTLFNRLRALIYDSELKSQIRLVLTGSHRIIRRAEGSPFWNVLKREDLHVFDRDGFNELVTPAGELPEELKHTIWQQSGGHPFIAQYLLHHLWLEHAEAGLASIDPQAVELPIAKLTTVDVEHLNGWVMGMEQAGLLSYDLLAAAHDWVAERAIIERVANPAIDIKSGLTALCYHGVVRHNASYTHYQAAGQLFRDWYRSQRERLHQTFGEAVASDGESIATAKDQSLRRPTIKILLLSANPLDRAEIRIDEEFRAIDEAMQKSAHRENYQLIPHGAVRVDDLQSLLLRHTPHIVHFSGHGSPASELMLQDATGHSVTVPTQALRSLFALLRDNIECVLLNACYSEAQAQTIATHIPTVIGMSNLLSDEVAQHFATAFYQALGYDRSYSQAFHLGISQIELHGLPEFARPVLIENQ
ncbi:MAG: CHAT domain-containing protein [Chloroflexota bacterium]